MTQYRLIPRSIGILVGSELVTEPVQRVIAHPPGTADTPIRSDLYAVEVITESGTRWFGFERTWIGSDLRMHVGPVNPLDEVRSKWEPSDEIGLNGGQ